jgi:hypothetical protein
LHETEVLIKTKPAEQRKGRKKERKELWGIPRFLQHFRKWDNWGLLIYKFLFRLSSHSPISPTGPKHCLIISSTLSAFSLQWAPIYLLMSFYCTTCSPATYYYLDFSLLLLHLLNLVTYGPHEIIFSI